ncbi:MAG: RhuM family protein [Candidatus Moranbacteria bacterium]|nr:RhuM family protein [Candidatus Moranbacteria bacterium]
MKRKKIPDNQIAFYQAPDGSVNIEVLYAEENIWLPQKRMAELFDTTPQNITQHLRNIYTEGELDELATCKDFLQVQKEKMGLTSWRRSPQGKIMPSDAVIAKNYLDKKELAHLNSIGNMYLDYAELQAARGRVMTMKDWIKKLNAFLKFSEYEILMNAGKISHEVAETLALKEFEKYRKKQDKNYISDFDREVKKLLKKKE